MTIIPLFVIRILLACASPQTGEPLDYHVQARAPYGWFEAGELDGADLNPPCTTDDDCAQYWGEEY